MYVLEGYPSREGVLEGLASVPGRLRALAGTATAAQLQSPGPGGGWSAFQVCCHVRDGALVYSSRFRWIVFNDDPVLPSMDEKNWVVAARDTVDDLPAMLDEIAASRADLMRVLSRLPDEAWGRTGRHEILGSVVLGPYVRHQLAHEEMHLSQIAAALGAAEGARGGHG
jgi:hypothetical protein